MQLRRYIQTLALIALLGVSALADPPLKIGVYSGTFDPPHVGHEALIKAIKEKLGVDVLYVIPNVTSDHKAGANSYELRREMSEAAFGKIPGVELPDAELKQAFLDGDMDGVMTKILERKTVPGQPKPQLFQVMGDDSFERFMKVPNKKFYENRTVVVVPREGKVTIPAKLEGTPVMLLDTKGVEIPEVSSSKIRLQIMMGERPPMLSDEVWAKVQARKLYAPAPACATRVNQLDQVVEEALKGVK